MAIGFNNLNGGAKKSSVDYMKLVDGVNTFRIIKDTIVPSYTYWVKGANGKEMPFECLAFVPDNETFDRSASDPVRDLGLKDGKGEDLKCKWSYRCQVINKATGKVQVLQLKKGMLEDIISVANQLEFDPSCPDTGTWLHVNREKTGPLAYNVKYALQQLKIEKCPLTDEERALVAEAKPISELLPRETYDAQMNRLRKHLYGDDASEAAGNTAGDVDNEAVNELD